MGVLGTRDPAHDDCEGHKQCALHRNGTPARDGKGWLDPPYGKHQGFGRTTVGKAGRILDGETRMRVPRVENRRWTSRGRRGWQPTAGWPPAA